MAEPVCWEMSGSLQGAPAARAKWRSTVARIRKADPVRLCSRSARGWRCPNPAEPDGDFCRRHRDAAQAYQAMHRAGYRTPRLNKRAPGLAPVDGLLKALAAE